MDTGLVFGHRVVFIFLFVFNSVFDPIPGRLSHLALRRQARVAVGPDARLLRLDHRQLFAQPGELLLPQPAHRLRDRVPPLLHRREQVLEGLGGVLGTPLRCRLHALRLQRHGGAGRLQAARAQPGAVQQDLRHPLDGHRQRDDGVRAPGAVAVPLGGAAAAAAAAVVVVAVAAEDDVARLAEEQLAVEVRGAARHHVAPLRRHQVQQLVDDEAGREGSDAAARHRHRLAADGAAERAPALRAATARSGRRRLQDALQAAPADRVRALEQLRCALECVVRAQARAARQEAVAEVVVVDAHRFGEVRRHLAGRTAGRVEAGRHACHACMAEHRAWGAAAGGVRHTTRRWGGGNGHAGGGRGGFRHALRAACITTPHASRTHTGPARRR